LQAQPLSVTRSYLSWAAYAVRFKYNPELVKKLLEKKRAAGKMTGSAAQVNSALLIIRVQLL
jgi:hypothetical protein